MLKYALAIGVLISTAGLSSAASVPAPIFNDDGNMVGVSGVSFLDRHYDVTFERGSCIELFDGCDDPEDFTFFTDDESGGAALTLAGDFDLASMAVSILIAENLDSVVGCGAGGASPFCYFLVPSYLQSPRVPGTRRYFGAYYIHENGVNDVIGFNDFSVAADDDLSGSPSFYYTKWTEITPIPLPASVWLMAAGLGLLGWVRRRG